MATEVEEPFFALKVGRASCYCVHRPQPSAEEEVRADGQRRRSVGFADEDVGHSGGTDEGESPDIDRTRSSGSWWSTLLSDGAKRYEPLSQHLGQRGVRYSNTDDVFGPFDDDEEEGHAVGSRSYLVSSERSEDSQCDMLPRMRLCLESQDVAWMHKVLTYIWPKVDAAVFKIMTQRLQPRIQELSPALRGVHFKSFTLGKNVPHFRRVGLWKAPCSHRDKESRGIELRAFVELRASTAEDRDEHGQRIELADSYTRMVAGVSHLTIEGELIIRLQPLLCHWPIVGGVVAYFLDSPKVEARFEGLAKIAEFAMLQRSVRNIINREIAQWLVLPNVVSCACVKNEDVVDTAVLRDPKPAGVLRVTAMSARNLTGVDWHFFGEATSDPYLRIFLSADEWKSSVVEKCCNPVWPESQVKDFMVYDKEQKVQIDVHDWGMLKSSDLLGQTGPLTVVQCLHNSEKPIPLFGPSTDGTSSQPTSPASSRPAGEVILRFEWLRILSVSDEWADGAVVRVKFDEVYVPSSMAEDRIAVRGRIELPLAGQIERTTKVVKGRDPRKDEDWAGPEETIYEVEQVLNIMLPKGTEPEHLLLELAVVTPKGRILGIHIVDLGKVAEAPANEMAWPRGFGKMRFKSSDGSPACTAITGEVVVSWLALEAVPQHKAVKDLEFTADKELDAACSQAGMSLRMSRSRRLEGAMDELEWVNMMFQQLWPKLEDCIRATMENPEGRVNLKLQARMPRFLKNIRFSRFKLGTSSPLLKLLKIDKAPFRRGHAGMEGVELQLKCKLIASEDAIEIDTGLWGLKIGVRSFVMEGELVVRLDPLLEEMPVVGGVVVCCLNRPRVDMHFSGLAAQVVDRGMEGSLRSLIDWGISSCFVMPNVLGFALAKESQGVDRALLRHPGLVGVLRVTVQKAKVWDASYRFMALLRRLCFRRRCCTSRLKLVLRVGEHTHYFDNVLTPSMPTPCSREDVDGGRILFEEVDSSSTEGEEDPSRVHDFLMYDERQRLEVEFVDRCLLESVVANIDVPLDCNIDSVVMEPNRIVKVTKPSGQRHMYQPEGKVSLKLERLVVMQRNSKGTDTWSMVRVKIDELYIPAALMLPEKLDDSHKILGLGVCLVAKIGDATRSTPVVRYQLREERSPVGSSVRDQVLKSVSELQINPKTMLELEMEWVLFLPVRRDTLEQESLQLELVSRSEGVIGTQTIPLSSIAAKLELKVSFAEEGNRLKLSGPPGRRELESEAMLEIDIKGLELATKSSSRRFTGSRSAV